MRFWYQLRVQSRPAVDYRLALGTNSISGSEPWPGLFMKAVARCRGARLVGTTGSETERRTVGTPQASEIPRTPARRSASAVAVGAS